MAQRMPVDAQGYRVKLIKTACKKNLSNVQNNSVLAFYSHSGSSVRETSPSTSPSALFPGRNKDPDSKERRKASLVDTGSTE